MWQEASMNSEKENPIAAQSKQWILSALLDLMKEKDFSMISITELAKRADLDRKTFYRNFHSKEDVISLKLYELCRQYIKKLQTLSSISAYELSKAYFEICASNKDFLSLLNQHNLLPLALLKFNEYLPTLNELFLSNPTYRNKSKYELAYQAGGFWNITIRWLNDGCIETADEMATIMSSIMPSPLK